MRLQPHRDLAYRTIGYLNEAKDGSFEGRGGLKGLSRNSCGGTGRSIRQMMSDGGFR